MFGEFIKTEEMISEEQLSVALKVQSRFKKKKLGRILVSLGYLSTEALNIGLSQYLNAKTCHSAKSLQEMANKHRNGPLSQFVDSDNYLVIDESSEEATLLFPETIDDEMIERVEIHSSKRVHAKIASREIFEFVAEERKETETSTSGLYVHSELSSGEKLKLPFPYNQLFKRILLKAIEVGSSDIHIEPHEKGIFIKMRVHGQLILDQELGEIHRESFISKVKDIVGLDLAVSGRPQDCRANFKDYYHDARVNSFPTLHGEKIVLRLIEQNKKFELDRSGLSSKSLMALRKSVQKKSGLILISGPTGSGKTSTLYALLSEIDRERKNISTIENPVEYELKGINQANITENGNMDFALAIRALMRQDPDIILIGEIRDPETAKAAFSAASTGHLVLSTVHANSSVAVVERLINLGIDKLSIRSNLILSCAQRLIPELCKECSKSVDLSKVSSSLSLRKSDFPVNVKTIHALGCLSCQGGLTGKTAILEYLDKHEIGQLLQQESVDFGYTDTLKDQVTNLVVQGLADYQELLAQ